MALLGRYIPDFEHLSDDELRHRLHCWEHCALVTFRTQRQLARMHVRLLRAELTRRETARTLAGVVPFSAAPSRDDLPTA